MIQSLQSRFQSMRNMDELYEEILAYIDEQGLHWIAVARHEDYRRSANWVQYSQRSAEAPGSLMSRRGFLAKWRQAS